MFLGSRVQGIGCFRGFRVWALGSFLLGFGCFGPLPLGLQGLTYFYCFAGVLRASALQFRVPAVSGLQLYGSGPAPGRFGFRLFRVSGLRIDDQALSIEAVEFGCV